MSFFEHAGVEWEPFVALAPHVRGLHCRGPASRRFLIALRAIPMHLLGVVDEPTWADGGLRSPREFFYHDLDHARYKVREDLLALGFECPDVSAETPAILPFALAPLQQAGPLLWQLAPTRLRLARELFAFIDALPDSELGLAAEWLLFEILHEKSFPLDRRILRRELLHTAHVAKLERKQASGFNPDACPEVFGRLPEARLRLLEIL